MLRAQLASRLSTKFVHHIILLTITNNPAASARQANEQPLARSPAGGQGELARSRVCFASKGLCWTVTSSLTLHLPRQRATRPPALLPLAVCGLSQRLWVRLYSARPGSSRLVEP